jgi:hypothetical protein
MHHLVQVAYIYICLGREAMQPHTHFKKMEDEIVQ